MASHVRATFIFFCLAAASTVRAADLCPAPPNHTAIRPPEIVGDDHRIHIDSDDAVVGADGNAIVNGRVILHQDERSVAADRVTFDSKSGRVAVAGGVSFEDPQLRVRSLTGSYDTTGAANFNQASFQLMDRNGRGFAKDIDARADGKLRLSEVRYTSCPVGNESWILQAASIDLDTKAEAGVARGVLMRFKDVPILYTPYLSFPIGDQRKSGLLFPSIGHSGKSGFELEVPYYFNLAPNYDLTLTPGLLSARGVQLGGEFRYLTARSHGQVDATFLPSDSIEHINRSYLRFTNVTDIRRGLRFDADIANVSDSNYFQDFAVGSDQTSVTYLERRADLLYYDDAWRIRAQLQNFQTIDTSVTAADRPYSRVPRVQAQGLWHILNSNFEFAVDGEAVNFLRNVGPTGIRVDVAPELRWSNRGRGYFFEPAVGYRYTQYQLQNATFGASRTPSRALPYGRVDTGLIFERDAGSHNERTQTLEPRLVYSYVPYRNQNELPIFDSGLPDLNLTELFRTNRYVGSDRFGDANQLALAMTTRLFDQISGTQYLSATIGQIRYFSLPRVGLPQAYGGASAVFLESPPGVNPLALPNQSLLATPAPYPAGQSQIAPAVRSSDIVAAVSLTAYKNFGFNLDYQWNPNTSQKVKSEVAVQYRPDRSRVVNLGYRYQQGIFRQWDGSFAWPISDHWNTVGRWVYSVQDRKTIEQVAGFEYKSCCYRFQLVQRRYISNRFGGLDTSFALQLELSGLSSVGKREDSFLERSIRGYSTRDRNARETP